MSGVFSGIGRLEIAPANTPNDPSPYYIDISTYRRSESTPLQITRGRQTELDSIQPSQLTCLLDNTTGIFTPYFDPTTNVATDTFNRTVSGGFGTADTGQTWAVEQGPTSDFSVAPGTAVIVPSVQGSSRVADINGNLTSGEIVLDIQVPNQPSANQHNIGASRGDSTGTNFHVASAVFDPSGSISLVLRKIIVGSTTDLATLSTSLTFTNNPPGSRLRLRFNIFGPVLRAKLWSITNGSPEPSGWLTLNNTEVSGTRWGIYARDDTSGAGTTYTMLGFQFNNSGIWGGKAPDTGTPVRYSETIGERTFTHFTGFIEFPDVDNWQPIGYQEVQLTATDLLARLNRTTPFVSTLATYIVNSARNGALKGYWPMSGPSLSFPDITGQQPPLTPIPVGTPSVAPKFNQSPIPPGDESPSLVTGYDINNYTFGGTNLTSSLANGAGIILGVGQVVTIVCWLQPNFPDLTNSTGAVSAAIPLSLDMTETPAASSTLRFNGSNLVQWFGTLVNGNQQWSTTNGVPIGNGWALPIAVQFGFNPLVTHVWIGGAELAPYTVVGSAATAITLNAINAPRAAYAGGIAHVQLYVGGPGDFTLTDLQAQQTMGYNALGYQTTGQRVNTILNYAGVPAGPRNVDLGQSFMSAASLAGKSAGQALQEAVDTERARAFIDGQGRYVFQDRQHTLNV